jgi:hypothetical protein
MHKYEICFSTPTPEPLAKLQLVADKYLDAYGLFQGLGAWRGLAERAYMVSVVLPQADEWKAYDLAKEYKRIYDQEAVLVTSYPVNAVLV